MASSCTYGLGFKDGFARFREGAFADVTVITSDGKEYELHSLLLANRSEFFLKALTSDFAEARLKRIQVQFEFEARVWEQLVSYFYSDKLHLDDDNVMAMLSLSRQLMVHSVDSYCLSFVRERLACDNCLSYLREAVTYGIFDLQKDCVALCAQGRLPFAASSWRFSCPALPRLMVTLWRRFQHPVRCGLLRSASLRHPGPAAPRGMMLALSELLRCLCFHLQSPARVMLFPAPITTPKQCLILSYTTCRTESCHVLARHPASTSQRWAALVL
jgi:hypothetical protein